MFDQLLDSTKKKLQGFASDLSGDIRGIGTDIQKSVQQRGQSLGNVLGQQDRSVLEQGFRIPIEGVLLGSDIAGSVIKGGVKALLNDETEQKLSKAIGQTFQTVAEQPVVQTTAKKAQELYNSLPKEVQGPTATIGLLALGVSDWATRGKTSELWENVAKELARETDEKVIKTILDTSTALDTKTIDLGTISRLTEPSKITKYLQDTVKKDLPSQILVPDQATARIELETLRNKLGDDIIEDAYTAIRQAPAKTKTIVEDLKTDYADILKVPEVPKSVIPDDPLLTEARKYKTADEFIQAQGKPLYHGSPNGIIDKIDATKLKPNGELGSGFYLSEDYKMASNYTGGSGKVNEINIGGLKILNTSKGGLYGFVENAIKSGSKEKYIQSLKDAGYDGIRVMDKGETVIFPESVSKIKTKSQLEEIFNKAQEKPAVKETPKQEVPTPKEEPRVPENFYAENRSTPSVKSVVSDKIKSTGENIASGAEYVFKPLSSLLEDIDPSLKDAIRKFEMNTGAKTNQRLREVKPFTQKVNKMKPEDRADFDLARKNGDTRKIDELIKQYNLGAEYKAYRQTLDSIYDEANKLGIDVGYIKEYAPRQIKDSQGLLTHLLAKDADGVINKAIQEKADKLGRPVESFTVDEKAAIANSLLRGYSTSNITLSKPSFAKVRSIDVIDKATDKFYRSSDEALDGYIRAMSDVIEARKFFGTELKLVNANKSKIQQADKSISKNKSLIEKWNNEIDNLESTGGSRADKMIETRKAYIQDAEAILKGLEETKKTLSTKTSELASDTNIEDNIGAYVIRGIAEGKIKPQDEKKISDALKSRFNYKGSSGLIEVYKNLEYASTMGNPLSTITQLGDFAFSMYKAGIGNTVKAALGKKVLKREDLGIDKVAQEFSSSTVSSKVVNAIFKATGLEDITRFSQETLINASLNRLKQKVKTADRETMDKVVRIYGDEAEQFIKDVEADKITENVRLWTYNDIADINPISLSEMPRGYLDHPNGRVMYMLKSYTIKLLDTYRRDVVKEMTQGDPAKGMKNLVSLVGLLAVGNATADEVKEVVKATFQGEEFEDTSLSDRTIESLLKAVGLNRYMGTTLQREGASGVIADQVLPPFSFTDAVTRDILKASKGEDFIPKSIERIPLIGREAYWWLSSQGEDSGMGIETPELPALPELPSLPPLPELP